MQRKHIITLSGKPGSGKSSTADKVAEMLGYTRYSSGDIVRKIVAKRGITLEEFNQQAEDDRSIDHEIDDELRALREQNDIVVDSRLGFYWIPESFKVYLDLDIDVASVRIFRDLDQNAKRSGEHADTMEQVAHQVRERMQGEQERFRKLYGVDPYDTAHFDLIINTSRHTPQTVALAVFDHYRQWLDSETWTQVRSEIPLGYSMQSPY